jgi:hypothetical protein
MAPAPQPAVPHHFVGAIPSRINYSTDEPPAERGSETGEGDMKAGIYAALAAAAAAVTPAVAQAENWAHYASNANGNRHFYDRDSVRVAGDVVSVADKSRFPAPDHRGAIERVIEMQVNCRDRRSNIASVTVLGEQGRIIAAEDHRHDPQWEPVPPGSVNEGLFQILCPAAANR